MTNDKAATPIFRIRRGEFGSVYVVDSDGGKVLYSPTSNHDRLASDLQDIFDAYQSRIESQQAEIAGLREFVKSVKPIIIDRPDLPISNGDIERVNRFGALIIVRKADVLLDPLSKGESHE